MPDAQACPDAAEGSVEDEIGQPSSVNVVSCDVGTAESGGTPSSHASHHQ